MDTGPVDSQCELVVRASGHVLTAMRHLFAKFWYLDMTDMRDTLVDMVVLWIDKLATMSFSLEAAVEHSMR